MKNDSSEIFGVARAELSAELPEDIIADMTALTLAQLRRHADLDEDGSDVPDNCLEMMVGPRSGVVVISVKPRHLVTNLIFPRTLKDGAALYEIVRNGGAADVAGYLAFLVGLTALASRTVKREEALTLHLLWRIARADGYFTLDDAIAAGPQLAADYRVVKVSPVDMEDYVNNLVLHGAVSETVRGYRLVEDIYLWP